MFRPLCPASSPPSLQFIITSSGAVQQAQIHPLLQIDIQRLPESSPQFLDRYQRKLYATFIRLLTMTRNQDITVFT